VAKPTRNEHLDWDLDRESYLQKPPVAYAPAHRPAGKKAESGSLLSIRGEERFGCLIAAAGTIWAVYVATVDYNSLWRMQIMPPGPVEVCAVGILAWLHAKWRRSIQT
jgi:hypothetical protein